MDTSELQNNGYILLEQGSQTIVYFIRAKSEEDALVTYLSNVHDYSEGANHKFRHKTINHDDVNDALNTYGIYLTADGFYLDHFDQRYASLTDVTQEYNIVQSSDGRVTSYGKAYNSLDQAMDNVVYPYYRIEIALSSLKATADFQVLFASMDVQEAAATATIDEIAEAHIIQSLRYEYRQNYKEASNEAKRALALVTLRREKCSIHTTIVRLAICANRLDEAVLHLRRLLRICDNVDSHGQISYRLAKLYVQMHEYKKAKYHLENALAVDPEMDNDFNIQKTIESAIGTSIHK